MTNPDSVEQSIATSDWAQQRTFPYLATEFPLLATAWDYSRNRISQLQTALAKNPLPDHVATVAISGSLSRMEAHSGSDLDVLIVLDDRSVEIDEVARRAIYDQVWHQLKTLAADESLKPPKPGGVFSSCVSWRKLIDPKVRGIVNEDVTTYGQRMQSLLDAQPVTGHSCCQNLQLDLLNWYAETRIADQFAEAGVFHWLWQDVQRYWRSIRARATWLHATEPLKCAEVNLKLRSSRMVLVAAFLQAIEATHAATSDKQNSITDLQKRLTATPIERIALSLADVEERTEFLRCYQSVWDRIRQLSQSTVEITNADRAAMNGVRRGVTKAAEGGSADWVI